MCDVIYSLVDDKVLRFIGLYVPDGKDELKSFELNFLVSSFEKAISDGITSQHFRNEINARIMALMALELSKIRSRTLELKKMISHYHI